jgi:hypothetical protein
VELKGVEVRREGSEPGWRTRRRDTPGNVLMIRIGVHHADAVVCTGTGVERAPQRRTRGGVDATAERRQRALDAAAGDDRRERPREDGEDDRREDERDERDDRLARRGDARRRGRRRRRRTPQGRPIQANVGVEFIKGVSWS